MVVLVFDMYSYNKNLPHTYTHIYIYIYIYIYKMYEIFYTTHMIKLLYEIFFFKFKTIYGQHYKQNIIRVECSHRNHSKRLYTEKKIGNRFKL